MSVRVQSGSYGHYGVRASGGTSFAKKNKKGITAICCFFLLAVALLSQGLSSAVSAVSHEAAVASRELVTLQKDSAALGQELTMLKDKERIKAIAAVRFGLYEREAGKYYKM